MKIEQLCIALKEYLSQFSLVRILMPLSAVILYVCGGLSVINEFFSLGSVVIALAFLLSLVMMVLTLAQCQFFALSVGIGLRALSYAIQLLSSLFQYHYLAYTSLIYLLFYGALAFLAYRKSMTLC